MWAKYYENKDVISRIVEKDYFKDRNTLKQIYKNKHIV